MSQSESSVGNQYGSPFADQLTIDTPEQVDLRLPLASAGSRLLAILADTLLQAAVAIVLFVILFLLLTAAPSLGRSVSHVYRWSGSAQKWLLAGLILVQFLLLWGYFSLFEAFWNGQTPGKRLLRIRVLQDSGRPITLFESLARNLLRVIDMLPSIYLVGLVAMLCNRQGKRLGDLLAGTLVVHEGSAYSEPLRTNSSRVLLPDAGTGAGAFGSPFTPSAKLSRPPADFEALPADALARLQPADLRVLETFFARNLDLPLQVRHAMAGRIAEQLTGRMQWTPPDAAEHPERLLEALLFALRER